jgi:hypothetical protein
MPTNELVRKLIAFFEGLEAPVRYRASESSEPGDDGTVLMLFSMGKSMLL